jgi:hypothetical protein
MNERTKEQIVHFAPSQKAMRQVQPMCDYVGPADDISMDPRRCTCTECLDWIKPAQEDGKS